MKKEYLAFIAVFLFFLSYVLDFLAGPIKIAVQNPTAFFDQTILFRYPLTAVEIFARSLGLIISILLVLDQLEKRPFVKALIIMILSMLAGFYAVQQLATGGSVTPLQWTLSFAFAAGGIAPFVFYYIFRGIIKALFSGLGGKKNQESSEPQTKVIQEDQQS